MNARVDRTNWLRPMLVLLVCTPLLYNPAPVSGAASGTEFDAQWFASRSGRGASIAWGDVNADGAADLALGIEYNPDSDIGAGGGAAIYLNTGRSLAGFAAWSSAELDPVSDLEFVDINRDNKLDLATSSSNGTSRLYLNMGTTAVGGLDFQPVALATPLPAAEVTTWADYDNDGDADLFLGGTNSLAQLYRNDTVATSQANIVLTRVFDNFGFVVYDAAWGDYNGDSLPDLALATDNKSLVLLRNSVGGVGERVLVETTDVAHSTIVSGTPDDLNSSDDRARSLDWADYDGDGDRDLAVGSFGRDRLYVNNGLELTPELGVVFGNAGLTRGVAWGDHNGDGKPDLALARDTAGVQIFTNTTVGAPAFSLYWSDTTYEAFGLSWADYDGDGDSDLAQANTIQPSLVYRNTRLEANSTVQLSLNGQAVEDALIYRLKSDGGTLFKPYVTSNGVPRTTDGSGQLTVGIELAPDDELIALIPAFQPQTYPSSNVPLAIDSGDPNSITSTLTIAEEGIVRSIKVVGLTGTHTWVSDLRFTLYSPSGKAVLLGQGLCGNEDDFALTFDDGALAEPACPLTTPGTSRPQIRLAVLAGEQISGTWKLEIADEAAADGGQLTGWGLEIDTAPYQLYYSSARPTEQGVAAYRVMGGGTQTLAITETHPLLVFDLDVSLEWDARNDKAYLDQLTFDLRRAAEFLYDYTDGQATLGTINVYHQRKRWNDANVRIYASNRLRPNAQKGGITKNVIYDPDTEEVAYSSGEVRMGAVWNRFGNSSGTVGEDWPSALAHELGHYLFFLEDNYLGLDGTDQLIAVEGCLGAMFDPYREDFTEFTPLLNWLPLCELTLSNRFTGRSDWQTIQKFYPELRAPLLFDANPGPSYLPLDIVKVVFDKPTNAAVTFENPLFDIINFNGGRVIPGESARAFLFQDDQIIDLGRPVVDKIEARGARPGDRICLYEPDAARFGCIEQVTSVTNKLTLYPGGGAYPFDVKITPVATDTISIELQIPASDFATSVELSFYQPELEAVSRASATPEYAQFQPEPPSLPVVTGRYTATIKAAGPIDTGYLHVQLGENISPSRELVVDYSQLGRYSLEPTAAGGAQLQVNRPCVLPTPPGCKTSPAPTASADGQAFLYGRVVNYLAGNYYSLQGSQLIPPTPAWQLPVGRAYRFVSSAGAASLTGISLNISYLENEVPYGAEGGIGIYFRPASGGAWQRLPSTRFDPRRNEVAAKLAGDGLYLLMTTLPLQNGWNNIAYPWQESTPLAVALERLAAGNFTTIYGYNLQLGTNPWQVYDVAAPPYVNTLTTLEYGRGYWINLEGLPTTATGQARTASAVPVPPATYYGQVLASDTLSPTVGLKVQAVIGVTVCGEALAQSYNDAIVFAITVPADDGATWAGCGAPGRQVLFVAAGTKLPYIVNWTNDRPRELRLLHAPIMFQ